VKVNYKSHTIEEVRNQRSGQLLTRCRGPKVWASRHGHKNSMIVTITKMIDAEAMKNAQANIDETNKRAGIAMWKALVRKKRFSRDGCPTCGGALTELGVCEDCGAIE
jgi:hypothetical protein